MSGKSLDAEASETVAGVVRLLRCTGELVWVAMLVDAMKRHLAEFPAVDEELVFRGPLVPSCVATTFIDRFAGHRALSGRVFRPDSFHFHDLCHTGKQPGSGKRCQHPRADAPHGPRDHACCIDLPARDGRARSRDRRCVAVPDRTRTQRDGAHKGPRARSRRIIFGPGAKERGR
jgi:hypothetical protein